MPPLALGRERSEPREMGERLWKIPGRVVADAWWSARRDLRPKQETLQYVARTLLGDSKLAVDRRNMDQEWVRDPDAVMEYCEHDADLAYRILERLRTMAKAADLATVAHLPVEEGLNGRTSLFIDSILIPRADARNVGVPANHYAGRDNPIEGGYVHGIRPGLYPWVVVLDFKSMYPSIIIARNLCFTTLSPDGTTVAPNGAKFLDPSVRRGIIPEILAELLADRARFRAAGRAASDPETSKYYDGLQDAVKVLMNSFYGVLASSFYRFTNKEIGAAITAFARQAITSIIQELEKDGMDVVYSDTDSVFVRSPVTTLEGAREFGESLARRFSHEGVTFEFQSVYEAFFSHGVKKRYVGKTAWPREELIVRGYETRTNGRVRLPIRMPVRGVRPRPARRHRQRDPAFARARPGGTATGRCPSNGSWWPGRSARKGSTTPRRATRSRSYGSTASSAAKGTTSSRGCGWRGSSPTPAGARRRSNRGSKGARSPSSRTGTTTPTASPKRSPA